MSSEPQVKVNIRKPIIGVDFDGTIVEHAYPMIGEPMPHAMRVLKRLSDAGIHLILWTCREDEGRLNFLAQAVKYVESYGIKIRSVNTNHPDDEFRPPDSPRRKIYADMYIDDRNFPPIDPKGLWPMVEMYAEQMNWIPPHPTRTSADKQD